MKGRNYEIYIYLYDYKKSKYIFSVKTGASVIRPGIFPENTGMGAGKYESIGAPAGIIYAESLFSAIFLFLPDSKIRKGI